MQQQDTDNIIGINWGSSNLRAYLIGADGQMLDSHEAPAGVTTLDRGGMAAAANDIRTRWPKAAFAYAAGMIGSNVGWVDAGYIDCPAGVEAVAQGLVPTRIGMLDVSIVPGMACVRALDGAPDVLRGEETELLGLLSAGDVDPDAIIALPGTHTKWIQLSNGRVEGFMTSMSGELFDRLASGGLLASVLDGPGEPGSAFNEGVRTAATSTLGLGALLFGVRAKMIRGALPRAETSSYLRGLLAGAEVSDAAALFPSMKHTPVPLVGSGPVTRLYQAAMAELGIEARPVKSADAVIRGFSAIHTIANARR